MTLLMELKEFVELVKTYGIDRIPLPRNMPALLRSRALTWCRNNNCSWFTKGVFRRNLLHFFHFCFLLWLFATQHMGKATESKGTFKTLYDCSSQPYAVGVPLRSCTARNIVPKSSNGFQLFVRRHDFKLIDKLFLLVIVFENLLPPHTPKNALRSLVEEHLHVTLDLDRVANPQCVSAALNQCQNQQILFCCVVLLLFMLCWKWKTSKALVAIEARRIYWAQIFSTKIWRKLHHSICQNKSPSDVRSSRLWYKTRLQ